MRRVSVSLFIYIVLSTAPGVVATSFTFTSIDPPGSTSTIAYGVNTGGQVVGYYTNASGIHGFLMSAGAFSTIDFQGASTTVASGINGGGQIVGRYVANGLHGFLLAGGSFTALTTLDSLEAFPSGINSSGQIVGSLNNGKGFRGFVQTGNSFNSFAFGGNLHTEAYAINDSGSVVGFYSEASGNQHGFLLDATGVFKSIDVPGASFTYATGINNAGKIVGIYGTSGGIIHGFLLEDGGFSTLDFPGTNQTQPQSISDTGEIVGDYAINGTFHGFTASVTIDKPIITSVATAYAPLYIAQNTWIEIHGTNLTPSDTPAGGVFWGNAPDFASGHMPTQLGGISVTVNAKPAYVWWFCSAVTTSTCASDQINVLTPLDTTSGPVEVVVTNGTVSSPPFLVSMQSIVPSFLRFSTKGYIAATHANFSLLGPTTLFPGASTPAQPGETILLYSVGFGLPSTPLINGSAIQSGPLPQKPICTIGRNQALVSSAALISPGLYQFNVIVPKGTFGGDNPVSCSYNGLATPDGALISVAKTGPSLPVDFTFSSTLNLVGSSQDFVQRTLSFVVSAFLQSDGTYNLLVSGESANLLPNHRAAVRLGELAIGPAVLSISGNTATFSGPEIYAFGVIPEYVDETNYPSSISLQITAATFTVTFTDVTKGSPIVGSISFSIAPSGTLQGTFTGTL